MISAGFSIGIFIFLTFTYFGVKFFLVDRKGPPMQTGMIKTVLSLLYLISIVGSQLSINIMNSKEHCNGVPQIVSAMIYTIIPNFFMLGLVMIILKVFPGWKEPFSNTNVKHSGVILSRPAIVHSPNTAHKPIKLPITSGTSELGYPKQVILS